MYYIYVGGCYRSTNQKWVQIAGQKRTNDRSLNQIAVDDTAIRINEDRFWLFAVVDANTNHLLQVRLFLPKNTVTIRMFSMIYVRNTRSTTPRSTSIENCGFKLPAT